MPECTRQPGCACHRWRYATTEELKRLHPFIMQRTAVLQKRGSLRTKREDRELVQLLAHRVFMPEPRTWWGRLREWWEIRRLGKLPTAELMGATTDDRSPQERATAN